TPAADPEAVVPVADAPPRAPRALGQLQDAGLLVDLVAAQFLDVEAQPRADGAAIERALEGAEVLGGPVAVGGLGVGGPAVAERINRGHDRGYRWTVSPDDGFINGADAGVPAGEFQARGGVRPRYEAPLRNAIVAKLHFASSNDCGEYLPRVRHDAKR